MRDHEMINELAQLDGLKTWMKDGRAMQGGSMITRNKLNRRDRCYIDTGTKYTCETDTPKFTCPRVTECKPYLTCYNAIISVIQKQSDRIITHIEGDLLRNFDTRFIHATPRQLAEALLRNTGKWKD